MKTYTLGQVIDNLKIDEIAVPVTNNVRNKMKTKHFKDHGLDRFYYNVDSALYINPRSKRFEPYGSPHSLAIVYTGNSEIDSYYTIMKLHEYREIMNNSSEDQKEE